MRAPRRSCGSGPGSFRLIQASRAEGAETCGICPVSSSAGFEMPVARPPADDIASPGCPARDARAERATLAVDQIDPVAVRGGGHRLDVRRRPPAGSDRPCNRLGGCAPKATMSRSTQRRCGMDCGTRRRATDSCVPSMSNTTALLTVSPLSTPSRLGMLFASCGFVTFAWHGLELSASRELSGRCDCYPPRLSAR